MIKLIVAMDEEGCIGYNGGLPWHLPDDLKFFKKMTEGHSILMGRKTWESLPRKPLPKRRNIVVSKNQQYLKTLPPEVATYSDLYTGIIMEGVFGDLKKDIFIAGGASIYAGALICDLVDEMYITTVHIKADGDVYFPLPVETHWNIYPVANAVSNKLHYSINHWVKKPIERVEDFYAI